MTNKDAAFKPWESKEYSSCSTTLLQPISARNILSTLAPYDLHKRLINDYILCTKGATSLLKRDTSRDKTDLDVIRENHKFLWDDVDNPDTWEAQLAKKYYDKLYKEYCICDLQMYKHNKIAMRWRTEAELISGKGQFTCGDKKCIGRDLLRTWEVNFAYIEQGEKKNALVKLRLCPECSTKLNYCTKKREVKRIKKKRKKRKHLEDEERSDKDEMVQDDSETQTEEIEGGIHEGQNEAQEENIWKDTAKPDEEKSREDEFEEYLEDLFL